jgi:hypothetical protein
MSKTKRYTCGNGDGMFESDNGFYVEFTELASKDSRIKELEARLETAEKLLKSSKDDLEWMWDNMGKPHTSDHFNKPANAINEINAFLTNKTE